MPDPGGRPPKLTKERIKAIAGFISGGSFFEEACRLANVSPTAAYGWKKSAKQKGAKPLAIEFAKAVKEAEARFEAFHLQNITRQSNTQWTASAWLLERKFPEKYGRYTRSDVTMVKKAQPKQLVLVRHSENGKGNVVAFKPAVGGNGGSARS